MRRFNVCAIFLGLVATAPLPALEYEEAVHLLRRTGFGPTPAEVEPLLALSREQAVDRLLDGIAPTPQTAPLPWCQVPLAEQSKNKVEMGEDAGTALKAWWIHEMIHTTSPLTERLLMIWHNHFTTEMRVVQDPYLIWEQHRLLREHALGNFGQLALTIPLDPAMFRYLDSDSNVVGRPNENFAREVMELFTVGEGNYTEWDIQEAARAFTGYKINPETGRAEMVEKLHDGGTKKVLGHRGKFDSEAILTRLLLAEEQVALNVARKFWTEFVSPDPQPKQIFEIAKAFYKGRYDMRPLLRATLLCESFWDPAVRGTLVKSPLEFVIGAVRQLGCAMDDQQVLKLCIQLGQEPFDPPNVKGWQGHTAWVTTESLMARQALQQRIANECSAPWVNAADGDTGQLQQMASLILPLAPRNMPAGLAARQQASYMIQCSLFHLK